MRESFNEYKEIIESNIIGVNFLYSGDIISSINDKYESNLNHTKTSPRFIIDAIDYIYEKSILEMFNRSNVIEKSLDLSKIDINGYWLSDIINSLDINSNCFVFIGDINKLGIVRNNNKKPFPDYFYDIKNLGNSNKLYKCPYIDKKEDEIILYVVNKPIQSLVYSIQNMSYSTIGKKHILKYNFYKCDYISYKLVIKDTTKMRNDKINSILN